MFTAAVWQGFLWPLVCPSALLQHVHACDSSASPKALDGGGNPTVRTGRFLHVNLPCK